MTLVLLPFLGVLKLLKQRAGPWLLWTVVAWTVSGACFLLFGPVDSGDRSRWTRAYFVGIVLGAAFLAIERLGRKRAVARWLKVTLACVTVAAFVKAILMFVTPLVEAATR